MLNTLEIKYSDIRQGLLSIREFENWVYNNEAEILKYYSQDTYESLIILNYNNVTAKREIGEILEIDFRKLELSGVLVILDKLIGSSKVLDNFEYSDSEDYTNYVFSFKLNDIPIAILNPFELDNFHFSLGDSVRVEEFKARFVNPQYFFQFLKSELISNRGKLVVKEELEEQSIIDYSEAFFGTQEETYIMVGQYRILVKKENLKLEMKNYWF